MRFTLNIRDYLQQYGDNMEQDYKCCPICYDHQFTGDMESHMRHMIECYCDQLIWMSVQRYKQMHGEDPVMSPEIETVLRKMAREKTSDELTDTLF